MSILPIPAKKSVEFDGFVKKPHSGENKIP
jgi:hypothetical protein